MRQAAGQKRIFSGVAAQAFISLLIFVYLQPGFAQGQSAEVSLPLFAEQHGKPVGEVAPGSFTIIDNKVPVTAPVKLIHGSDFPLALGILVDTSNSQRDSWLFHNNMQMVKDLATFLLKKPDDRVFVELFSTTVEATSFITSQQLSGLTLPSHAGGGTALFDALTMACDQKMAKAAVPTTSRKVIVLFSDGNDNQSRVSREEAGAYALSSGSVIFSIDTSVGRSVGTKVLDRLSAETGGKAYAGEYSRDLKKIFGDIQQQVEGMFYMRYAPPGNPAQNEAHRVEIKRTKGSKLDFRAPAAYQWNP